MAIVQGSSTKQNTIIRKEDMTNDRPIFATLNTQPFTIHLKLRNNRRKGFSTNQEKIRREEAPLPMPFKGYTIPMEDPLNRKVNNVVLT